MATMIESKAVAEIVDCPTLRDFRQVWFLLSSHVIAVAWADGCVSLALHCQIDKL